MSRLFFLSRPATSLALTGVNRHLALCLALGSLLPGCSERVELLSTIGSTNGSGADAAVSAGGAGGASTADGGISAGGESLDEECGSRGEGGATLVDAAAAGGQFEEPDCIPL